MAKPLRGYLYLVLSSGHQIYLSDLNLSFVAQLPELNDCFWTADFFQQNGFGNVIRITFESLSHIQQQGTAAPHLHSSSGHLYGNHLRDDGALMGTLGGFTYSILEVLLHACKVPAIIKPQCLTISSTFNIRFPSFTISSQVFCPRTRLDPCKQNRFLLFSFYSTLVMRLFFMVGIVFTEINTQTSIYTHCIYI